MIYSNQQRPKAKHFTLLEARDWLMPLLKAGKIWEISMFFPVLSLPGQAILMIIQPCYSHSPNYCSTAFPLVHATFCSTALLRKIFNMFSLLSYPGIYPLHSYPLLWFLFFFFSSSVASVHLSSFPISNIEFPKFSCQKSTYSDDTPATSLAFLRSFTAIVLPPAACSHFLSSTPPASSASQPVTTSSLLSYIPLTAKWEVMLQNTDPIFDT